MEDLVINRTELVLQKRDRTTVEDLKKDHIADIAELGQGHLIDQGRGHRIADDNMAQIHIRNKELLVI